jgi:hypothetical protein
MDNFSRIALHMCAYLSYGRIAAINNIVLLTIEDPSRMTIVSQFTIAHKIVFILIESSFRYVSRIYFLLRTRVHRGRYV